MLLPFLLLIISFNLLIASGMVLGLFDCFGVFLAHTHFLFKSSNF